MAYIDVPTSTDLVRDGMKVLTVVAATCNKNDAGAAVFTIETDGAYRIAMAGLGTAFAVVGNQIIVRASVSTANAAINNDGCYIIEAVVSADAIEVVKPVYPMTWKVYADAAAATFDEIDTFILHPTKRIEQICVFVINSAATNPLISFVPGPFWAASLKTGIPPIQGQPLGATSNLFQVETAKYLQTESEILIVGPPAINKAGTMLMRVIPGTNADSGATVSVGLIQLY